MPRYELEIRTNEIAGDFYDYPRKTISHGNVAFAILDNDIDAKKHFKPIANNNRRRYVDELRYSRVEVILYNSSEEPRVLIQRY
jgi:hypothetical protein